MLADSYCEAAGLLAAMRAGIDPVSLVRPLRKTPTIDMAREDTQCRTM